MNTIQAVGEDTVHLSDLFPNFWFAIGAETFLRKSATLDVNSQLTERRIVDVRMTDIRTQGALEVLLEGFIIHINPQLLCSERPEVLGHEIAHSFQYNLTHTPARNTLRGDAHTEVEMELFCEEFTARWLHANREKAVAFLAKM